MPFRDGHQRLVGASVLHVVASDDNPEIDGVSRHLPVKFLDLMHREQMHSVPLGTPLRVVLRLLLGASIRLDDDEFPRRIEGVEVVHDRREGGLENRAKHFWVTAHNFRSIFSLREHSRRFCTATARFNDACKTSLRSVVLRRFMVSKSVSVSTARAIACIEILNGVNAAAQSRPR